jgi:outer membrane lipopolysaccharide assembly protein LptE/RlpB
MGFFRMNTGRLPGRRSAAAALLLLALCAGATTRCGYRFQGEAKLPEGARRLHVELFENRTAEPGLETIQTNAVVFEFTKRGKDMIVGDPAQADLVMKGVIRSAESRTVASRNKDAAGERQVTLRVDIRLVRPDGKLAWEAKGVSDQESYPVSNDKFQNDDRQRVAVAAVATRVAERIYNRFTDDF